MTLTLPPRDEPSVSLRQPVHDAVLASLADGGAWFVGALTVRVRERLAAAAR